MKCFYASVECADRGLNPFESSLVVADVSRGKNAICLAISPKLKSLGIKNRCRINDIPNNIEYIAVKPRMKRYIEYAADIYDIYLDYISPEDIHVYSIDEMFLDITSYLNTYKITPKDFGIKLMKEIENKLKIPSSCGIGTNLYLSKIALDITAKKNKDHIGFLTEELFKLTLLNHTPLTDFWGISKGTVNRLKKYAIYDMQGIIDTPENLLYKEFGINAELLIDHANGRESCTMSDIKNYKTKSKSISNSQILFENYDADKAFLVMQEMTLTATQELVKNKLITHTISVYICYSNDFYSSGGGSLKLPFATQSYNTIIEYVKTLFYKHVDLNKPIRRLSINFSSLCDECAEGYDFFTNLNDLEKEKKLEKSVLNIKEKYGKNAILRGFDYLDGATQIERNAMIGGHNGE